MRCINKFRIFIPIFCLLLLTGCSFPGFSSPVEEFEKSTYIKTNYQGALLTEEIAVLSQGENVTPDWEVGQAESIGLFSVEDASVLYSKDGQKKIYPASVTKILTALVALEHGKLEDRVLITKNGAASSFSPEAQVCGLQEGDVLTLEALLYGLLLHSGNDSAIAIAEHIGGDVDTFVQMMNQKAKEVLATDTHFTNPSGLHDDEHYTTAYDLYLIFYHCIQNPEFTKIIQEKSYTATIEQKNGINRQANWLATNYYFKGIVSPPSSIQILGGKTGTTDEAKNCLILLGKDESERLYISYVMGSDSKEELYQTFYTLWSHTP